MGNNNDNLKNAVDFLLFSYFGITLDDNTNAILSAVIDRAYRDASSHVLSVNERQKVKLKKEAKQHIIDQIKKMPDKDGYDSWHNEVCAWLIKKFPDDVIVQVEDEAKKRKFTYGIAQKWINMTTKYLYLLNSIYLEFSNEHDFCKTIGNKVSNISKELHVPIDGYIIEAVWTMTEVKLPVKENKKRGYKYANPAEQVEPWSKWDNNKTSENSNGTYTDFQESLRGRLTEQNPIDWEAKAWIEVAKQKNKSNK